MPGSNTPKLPASHIHSWPGCQRRTSSFHSMRSDGVFARRGASSLRRPRNCIANARSRRSRACRARRHARSRSLISAMVGVGGFSSSTCLPASSASRAMAWRTLGGVQIATASRSGMRGIKFGRRAEGRHARLLEAALADEAGQFEARVLGDDRQMLVLRDLADADDGDAGRLHAALPRLVAADRPIGGAWARGRGAIERRFARNRQIRWRTLWQREIARGLMRDDIQARAMAKETLT